MTKRKIIDVPQVRKAMEELLSWQQRRSSFDARVAEEEEYYRLRVHPKSHQNAEGEEFAPTSAWLVNSILQKHADLMDHLPTAVCLAREPSDEAAANALSAILPVIFARCHFEDTYSDNMWYKLKHGVCAYGVFFNKELENGLGDIEVRRVELANLFWQPNVRDIESSRAVYVVERVEESLLRAQFPHYKTDGVLDDFPGLESEGDSAVQQVIVVDWYYKKRLPDGRTVLHYCKFAGDNVLFASENEAGYENGWYEHGKYPFVIDVLYPIEGECTGFGMIALGRDPQTYIDRMDRNLLEYMDWATRVRFFCKKNMGINEAEFTDLSRRIVEVEGDLDEERMRQIRVDDLADFWLQLKNAKIEELKESTANRNFSQGLTEGGVTAASAIATLQEAGNKTVRDMVAASYRAFLRVVNLVVECVRQFYDASRCFRILGENGEYSFIYFSNRSIKDREAGTLSDGTPIWYHPLFDIDVRAEKRDPYTRISHNETLKDLYNMGVFQPENAAAASVLLSAMDFSGVAQVRQRVAANAKREEGIEAPAAAKPHSEDPLLRAYLETERLQRTVGEKV